MRAVVALEPAPNFVPSDDRPWGFPPETAEMLRQLVRDAWGSGFTLALASGVVSQDPRVLAAWQRYERMTATPKGAAWWLDYMFTVDVRDYLPRVQVPVLAVHAKTTPHIRTENLRWLCEQITHVRLVELEEDVAQIALVSGLLLDEVEDFIAGTRTSAVAHRQMVGLLITDLVGSTQTLARIGEHSWQILLQEHRRVVRDALHRHGGTEIDTAGDGFLATFRLASSALRCAADIRHASEAAGVAVRQGVHAGEVTLLEPGIAGQAVHATARLAGLAGAGEVFVSDAALALAGVDLLPTEPVGTRSLRGIPTRMRVHRLATARAVPARAPVLVESDAPTSAGNAAP